MSFGGFINKLTGANSSATQQFNHQMTLQHDAQAFNAQQAQIERDWQTQMSNTARQREMADLKAAGLNPVLASGATAGADAGMGAVASSPEGSASAGMSSMNILDTVLNTARLVSDIDKQNAETKNIEQDTKNKEQTYKLTPAMTKAAIEYQEAGTARLKVEKAKILAEKTEIEAKTVIENIKGEMAGMDVEKRKKYFDNELEIYKQQKIHELTEAGFDNSTIGLIINAIGKTINAASPLVPHTSGNTYNFTQSVPTVNY